MYFNNIIIWFHDFYLEKIFLDVVNSKLAIMAIKRCDGWIHACQDTIDLDVRHHKENESTL